ncbi:MAG TPA: 50S ribosomal protein L25 [Phycisphaerae bacterium]|jgi:large subunit ribosomal protein L25|nr:50S ribosomal protein L25 [Phycisphaerae bacterium]HOB73624.1 50S ribosomal protein L25 [Phycisphaerae bacterium]HOJ54771.1 50S ribosomal protein L25 [Phycisphaerae bacterium]HOL25877.1 50S ribosomal protein L25 [Phycisphaerae bacterium]HPP21191.1 50S ribosomal protein L25 [Phycisphaerae bacterium]
MDMTTLQAERREAGGSRAAARLRRTGKIPGIVYGHGEGPVTVAVSTRELAGAIKHGQHLVQLNLDGQTRHVLIKDVQYDHLASTPVHVDFMRVDMHQRVTVTVPLEFKGVPVGTNEGGIFESPMADIEIECAVTDIPEMIRVNVADLKLGDAIHVRDLQLPPNVTAQAAPDAIVCAVRAKEAEEAVEAAEEGAEAAEPEIISRREKTEEEGEGKEK